MGIAIIGAAIGLPFIILGIYLMINEEREKKANALKPA